MQLLFGARQCHVEQIDIVDVRTDALAVKIGRKVRIGHIAFVSQRNSPYIFELRVAAIDPKGRIGHRLHLPTAIGNYNHLTFKTFRLVNGRNLDRLLVLL